MSSQNSSTQDHEEKTLRMRQGYDHEWSMKKAFHEIKQQEIKRINDDKYEVRVFYSNGHIRKSIKDRKGMLKYVKSRFKMILDQHKDNDDEMIKLYIYLNMLFNNRFFYKDDKFVEETMLDD